MEIKMISVRKIKKIAVFLSVLIVFFLLWANFPGQAQESLERQGEELNKKMELMGQLDKYNHQSQEPSKPASPVPEYSLEIWNSDILWANHGNFAYVFTVDTQGLMLAFAQEEMTELTITTNYGEIEFAEEFNFSDATRYGRGILLSPEDLTDLVILKVEAKIGQARHSLPLAAVQPRVFKPIVVKVGS
jgi:hypothetical protein